MARTLDPAAHALKRDAFIDAAQRVLARKGYDQMSVQDVIDDLGTSKGAFYHYFDSKTGLLDAIVDRMVENGIARYGPIVVDPDRSALEKFEAFFAGIADYKAEQRELILRTMTTWLSEENTIVREHFRRGIVVRLRPLLCAIVRQGVDEGTFDVRSPDATAGVLVALLLGLNEEVTHLFFEVDAGTVPMTQLEARIDAYVDAFERVLGARPGQLSFGPPSRLREWHAWFQAHRKETA
jgi:AcrR family transcriptional regulator